MTGPLICFLGWAVFRDGGGRREISVGELLGWAASRDEPEMDMVMLLLNSINLI
jgi:hypothetical protein